MFPGATDGPAATADYAIIGAPLDISGSFEPGARFGPDRIRRFARGFEDYDRRTDQRFSDLGVIDRGDVRAWGDVPAYLDFLQGELTDIVDEETVPVVLGGEHTVSLAGVRATAPDVFLALDAHLDLRLEYDGFDVSHATVTHHALEEVDEAYVLGARSGSEAEWGRVAEDDAVTAVPPEDVATWIEGGNANDLTSRDVYLSVDIDAVDPAYAPATGTKEPMGISPQTARTVIRSVSPSIVGTDVVEVTDRDHGQTATLAAKLVRELIHSHAADQ